MACLKCLSLLAFVGAVPAMANLTFDVTYTSNVTGLPDYLNGNIPNAIQYVENEYSALYSNPITLNIAVDAGSTGVGASSATLELFGDGGYGYLTGLLAAQAAASGDSAQNSFVASLPASDPFGAGNVLWGLTCAEAKAIGAVTTACGSIDGTFTFNDTLSYTYDPNHRGVLSEYDFIGIAEHEFSEIMGRGFTLGTTFGGTPAYLINDLDRFTAPGVRSFANCQITSTSGIYLSANNGATNLAGFNNNANGDCDDLDGSVATDPYNAFTTTGQPHALTSVDVEWMNILGYDLAIPEPGTFGLVGGVLLAAGLLRKRVASHH